MGKKVSEFFREFIEATDNTNKHFTFGRLGNDELSANEAIDLILQGKKKAIFSSLYSYEYGLKKMPEVNEFFVATNWSKEPKCIIKTTDIKIMPFKNISKDIIKLGGKDNSLESWRKYYIGFFEEICRENFKTFDFNMPVVIQQIELIYI